MSDRKKLILGFLIGLTGVYLWNLYYDSYEKIYTVGEVIGTSTGLKSGTSVQFQLCTMEKKLKDQVGKALIQLRLASNI